MSKLINKMGKTVLDCRSVKHARVMYICTDYSQAHPQIWTHIIMPSYLFYRGVDPAKIIRG